MKKYKSQYEMMTQEPVASLILRLGLPTTVSMFVTSIYNMSDSYFVGRINTSASGATGVVLGLMAAAALSAGNSGKRISIMPESTLLRVFMPP